MRRPRPNENSDRIMTHNSARHDPSSRGRAVFKIDRIVLLAVLAGIGLAVLSSIGAEAPPDAVTAPAASGASFP